LGGVIFENFDKKEEILKIHYMKQIVGGTVNASPEVGYSILHNSASKPSNYIFVITWPFEN
jgi:hypothetical protein